MVILFNYSYQLYILISLTLNNDLPVSKAKIHTQNKKGFITFSVSEFSISFIKSVSQYYQRN